MNSLSKSERFPAGTRQAWEQAAREELQGGDPWQKLTREVQGIAIRPYYSREDAPVTPFRLAAADSGFLGPRSWYNCPRVIVDDPKEGNAAALEHLQHGADGGFFELKGPVDFKLLLNQIEWPICALHFQPGADPETTARSLARQMKSFSGPARGAWYGKGSSEFPADRSFHPIGEFIPASSSFVDSAAEYLARVVSVVRNFHNQTSPPVAFLVETGADFFFEVSRLRAIRQVWEKLSPASPLLLHACSSPWTPEVYAPHANMLKATTATMAAILGGADSVTVDPETYDQPMQRRVARNVAILLREESRFAKVADPLAGSYFVDHLTNDLSEKIWSAVSNRLRS